MIAELDTLPTVSSVSTGRARWHQRASIPLLFAGLAAIMTWPQARLLATHAAEHQDVYFNMWRLRWIAHTLATSPGDLFHGNQFYPERYVLAFSDALLVEGLIAAPLLWIGLPPVLVHNLMLLGAIVASATGVFVLARHLTGSTAGAIVAGVVFAFAPYRFEHYMHMELQWTIWMPWAFWSLQRTLETARPRYGVLTGIFVALQMTSSVYYGVFLSLLLAIVGGVQLLPMRGRHLLGAVRALVIGAAIAVTMSAAYSRPYSMASSRVGVRGADEVARFSAKPRDYRVATDTNLLFNRKGMSQLERQLFPGVLPAVLALVGLLLVPPTIRIVACVIGLALAFELSLGMNGRLYPWLYDHVSVLHGLRAPARASIFVLLFLGVLAAHGCAVIAVRLTDRARAIGAGAVVALLMLEYWVAPLPLIRYDNAAPPLYTWLARQPAGVVAEFPMPLARKMNLPGEEPRYLYMSTFHWKPLLNGYSGYYPPQYLRRLASLAAFPDEHSINTLREAGVRYVIVHKDAYSADEHRRIVYALAIERGLKHLGEFDDGREKGTVFGM
jgi:hypothetical protein